MNNKTATLIGATGLIGSHLLEILQDDPEYSLVKVMVRRLVTVNHPKVKVSTIDFTDKEAFKSAIEGSDVVFCAVGTTNRKVKGDKNEFKSSNGFCTRNPNYTRTYFSQYVFWYVIRIVIGIWPNFKKQSY